LREALQKLVSQANLQIVYSDALVKDITAKSILMRSVRLTASSLKKR
jgi:hypothetical protein